MYCQALTYQTNIHQLQKNNFGKMTMQEKRINKEDLVHYKAHQPEVEALIPGINHHASGGAHLKRARPRETEKPGQLKMSMSTGALQ